MGNDGLFFSLPLDIRSQRAAFCGWMVYTPFFLLATITSLAIPQNSPCSTTPVVAFSCAAATAGLSISQ